MKIVSIGEILFDCFQDKKLIGGAPFNFFYHICKLTDNAEFISRIGNDKNGKTIINFLKKNNINTKYIDEKHPTGSVNINVDKDGNPTFVIIPNCAYDFIELTPEIIELIESDTSLLYFSTLAQRKDVSRKTIQSLLNKNIKYFLDLNLRGNYYSKEILLLFIK
jgi:fructokinase